VGLWVKRVRGIKKRRKEETEKGTGRVRGAGGRRARKLKKRRRTGGRKGRERGEWA